MLKYPCLGVLTVVCFAAFFSCFSTSHKVPVIWLPDNKPWTEEQTPLAVRWDKGVWGDANSEAIRDAMAEFPCDLFVEWEPGMAAPSVDILLEGDGKACGEYDPPISNAAGVAYRCSSSKGEIWVQALAPGVSVVYTYVLLLHELGHIAGLDHDAYYYRGYTGVVSVMTPNVMIHTDRQSQGLLLPMILDSDMDALEERYCK